MPVLTNARHERFSQLVAGGANNTEAAKSLGYSPTRAASTGCNLAKDRNISARIAELSVRASEQAICSVAVDRAWVLGRLRLVVERCMQSEPITDDTGNRVFTFNPAGATRALELLGKELGLFTDRTDHNLRWDGDFSKLDEKQLATMTAVLEQFAAFGQPPHIAAPVTVEAGPRQTVCKCGQRDLSFTFRFRAPWALLRKYRRYYIDRVVHERTSLDAPTHLPPVRGLVVPGSSVSIRQPALSVGGTRSRGSVGDWSRSRFQSSQQPAIIHDR
jgi:phage terminase small subunit